MTRQVRVLVVDDDLDALYYVDDLLSEFGYYPIKATTADDAAEIVGALQLDAIVINLAMIATASESALESFERARDSTTVLVMDRTGSRPDGASSVLRGFLEHPPAAEDLARALAQCAAVPVPSGR